MAAIKESFKKALSNWRESKNTLLQEHKGHELGTTTIKTVYGGMRGVPSLVCDTSKVDPITGLHIRNIPIAELSSRLPEEIFWLLLVGALPDAEELKNLQSDLQQRKEVPNYVWDVLHAMPDDAHPMVMLSTLIMTLQKESAFYKAYLDGTTKDQYWESTLEDALNLIAKLPAIAAALYRKRFNKGDRIDSDSSLDWASDFAHMLGNDSDDFKTLMQLFMTLHCDHGGGNLSAFTNNVVSSALSDLYYSASAGLNGLAGPLHGLANQMCLRFILKIRDQFNGVPSEEELKKFTWKTLETGPIFGYGHAVLRAEDPRFTAFHKFGVDNNLNSEVFQIVQALYKVVPAILQEHGKAANPWPNIDAATGSLLYSYNLKEMDYYTVLFGMSRCLGFAAQSVIARGLGITLFRPKAVTTDWLQSQVQ